MDRRCAHLLCVLLGFVLVVAQLLPPLAVSAATVVTAPRLAAAQEEPGPLPDVSDPPPAAPAPDETVAESPVADRSQVPHAVHLSTDRYLLAVGEPVMLHMRVQRQTDEKGGRHPPYPAPACFPRTAGSGRRQGG